MRKHTTATVATALRDLADVLDAMTPAPAPAKPKAKAAAKVAPEAPAKKGARTRAEMSAKDWNRTLTAKARLAGKKGDKSVYSLVLADWSTRVATMRAAGKTPDQVLAFYTR